MRTDSVRMLEFAQHGDERGHLVVVEGMKDIPFEIKRVFYIYGSDADVVRGCHANRRSEFVLINVAGQSKVRVRDGAGNEAVFPSPDRIRDSICPEWSGRTCTIFRPIRYCWCCPTSPMTRRNTSAITTRSCGR